MNGVRFTRRGKIVVGVLIAMVTVATFWALINLVTPDECKVPASEMSSGCIALIYER